MDDVPDVFADEVMVNYSTLSGFTLTLLRSMPDPGVPIEDIRKPVVGYVRLSRELAANVAATLSQALVQVAAPASDGPKH